MYVWISGKIAPFLLVDLIKYIIEMINDRFTEQFNTSSVVLRRIAPDEHDLAIG